MIIDVWFSNEVGQEIYPEPFEKYEVLRTLVSYWPNNDPEDETPDQIRVQYVVEEK